MPRAEKPFDCAVRRTHGPEPVEGLFRFLASLMMRDFYGTATISFENGKATHVETQTRRMWQYRDLPQEEIQAEGRE